MDATKHEQSMLQQLTQRLIEAQRLANLGHWELDLVQNRLYWSDQIFRIFEIDKTEFAASYQAFLEAIHPDDRDAVNKAYTDSLNSRQPYEIAHRLLMADGRIKWVNERCETTFSEAGEPLLSIGTVQDITERVRNEEELRELNHALERRVSERTFELASERNFVNAILDTAGALILVLDESGRMVRFNRACELLTGYKQQEMLGLTPWDSLIPAEQKDGVMEVFKDLVRHRSPSLYENEWQTSQGERRLIAWSNSTMGGENGTPLYVIATGIDITERKAAETALINARNTAETASRAKSEFLARMSHELRTPMNAVLGFAQLLDTDEKSALPPHQKDYVQEILQAGTHLLDLINEVLDLSRIEAGRLQISMASVELGEVLRESLRLLQPVAEQHGIDLGKGAIMQEQRWVMADKLRLRQVIMNLLSNAIKYNRAGGSVRIDCAQLDDDRIQVSIHDTGPGLAPEQQAMLFQPFERLDADRMAIQGTGIGLALSKHLMHMMGGEIGVASTVDEGSTFWIRLSSNSHPA